MEKITYFDKTTGTWKERFDKEEPGYRVAEVGHPTYKQLKAVGAISGSRFKRFSEMSKEDLKLFSDDSEEE